MQLAGGIREVIELIRPILQRQRNNACAAAFLLGYLHDILLLQAKGTVFVTFRRDLCFAGSVLRTFVSKHVSQALRIMQGQIGLDDASNLDLQFKIQSQEEQDLPL